MREVPRAAFVPVRRAEAGNFWGASEAGQENGRVAGEHTRPRCSIATASTDGAPAVRWTEVLKLGLARRAGIDTACLGLAAILDGTVAICIALMDGTDVVGQRPTGAAEVCRSGMRVSI